MDTRQASQLPALGKSGIEVLYRYGNKWHGVAKRHQVGEGDCVRCGVDAGGVRQL